MHPSPQDSNSHSRVAIGGLVTYIVLLGVSVAIVPAFSLILGLLPLALLYFNQTWDFRAPIGGLHVLFLSAIILFILWPRYLAFNVGGPDITPARIAYGVLLSLWMIALISPSYRKELWVSLGEMGVWLALLVVYVLLRVVTSFTSDAPLLSLYQTANEILTAILVLPIVISTYDNRSRLGTLALWLLLAGVVVAVLALVEKAVGHTLFANVHIPGIRMDNEWLEQALMDKVRAGQYRAQSTFLHPLLLAEFMIFEIPLAIFYMVHRQWRWRTLGTIALMLFFAGAVVTGSRASLVAMPPIVLAAIVLLSMRRREGAGGLWIMTLLAIALGTAAGVVLLATGILDLSVITGRSSIEASSTNTRLLMLIHGLPLVFERPLVGYGPGLSAYVLGMGNARGDITIDNYYLSVALESGIPTLLVFVVMTFGFAIKGYMASLRDQSRAGLLGGMLSISLGGMLIVKSILSIPHNAPLLILCMALIVAIPRLQPEAES